MTPLAQVPNYSYQNKLFNCYEAEGEQCKHFEIYCLSSHRVLDVYYRHALQLSHSVWLNWRKRWDSYVKYSVNIWKDTRNNTETNISMETKIYRDIMGLLLVGIHTAAIQNASWAFDVHLFRVWFMGGATGEIARRPSQNTNRMNRLYWGIFYSKFVKNWFAYLVIIKNKNLKENSQKPEFVVTDRGLHISTVPWLPQLHSLQIHFLCKP